MTANVGSLAIELATAGHESLSLARDESHSLLTRLIRELDAETARDVINQLVVFVHAVAAEGDVDLDEWLPRAGLSFADGLVP